MRVLKAITWTLIALIVTTCVGRFITGSWETGSWISVICRTIKFPLYYYHDRGYDSFAKWLAKAQFSGGRN